MQWNNVLQKKSVPDGDNWPEQHLMALVGRFKQSGICHKVLFESKNQSFFKYWDSK